MQTRLPPPRVLRFMYFRAFCVWLILIGAEIIHGTLRMMFLAPRVGDFRARQISAVIGSAIVLMIAFLFARWIDAKTPREHLAAGALWLILTLVFEIGAGRILAGYSWQRILEDYDPSRGGLLGPAMLVLGFSPLITGKLRDRMG